MSHTYWDPRKYSFALLFGKTAVVRLDVGPRRPHANLLQKNTVECSHWHYYGNTEVLPDDREIPHRKWLDAFCEKCNIALSGSYSAPAHDKEQLEFGV